MVQKHYIGLIDYIVICFSLLISVGIGVYAKLHGGKKTTAKEYLLAGKKMSKLPVIFSIIVTLVSPSSVIGLPAETYRYGAAAMAGFLAMPFGMLLAAWVFLPVYFQCGVSTVNEFLELRYGKIIRYILSSLFLVQMVFFMSTALYGAVLALSAVTNLPLELSIITLGVVCALYCSIGGLKAVLWTDAFQAVLVLICVISIYAAAFHDIDSISKVYRDSLEGQRLNIFDFDFSLTKRYTVWNSVIRCLVFGFGFYGTNQIEVQRTLTMSTIERAKSSLRFSIIPGVMTYFSCYILGLMFFSIFYQCDPILNKQQTGVKRYDQLVPWYIVNKFSSLPGMTGLVISGIFSASLSSISSALNSASTVTVVDCIKPLYKSRPLSDFQTVLFAKILSIVYGGICIGLAFCFLDVHNLIQLSSLMVGSLEGPVFAVFLIGVLTRKASDKCVSFAVVLGWSVMVWISYGALYYAHKSPPLPLSTSMCPSQNFTQEFTIATSMSSLLPKRETFILYKISFVWHPFMGFILTLILIFFTALVTGWKNIIPEDSKCLSPVTRFWMKQKSQKVTLKKGETHNDHAELSV